jgi:hypothetical protein
MANLARHVLAGKDMVLGGLLSTVDWLPMASVVKYFARIAVKRGNFTAALERGDPYLEDLTHWYRNNAKALGIDTVSYYENSRVKGAAMVVIRDSANPETGSDPAPVDADHFTICKPEGRNSHYALFYACIKGAVENCPVFRETHLAALDVKSRFMAVAELRVEERLNAVKNVIVPIEVRLGRDPAEVDYRSSRAGSGEFTVTPWQEEKAEGSNYDLDRIILYVWNDRRGKPGRESTRFVRQERERLKKTGLKDKSKISLIPLHYAVRTLQRHQERGNVKLAASDKVEVQSTLELLDDLDKTLKTGGGQVRTFLKRLLCD